MPGADATPFPEAPVTYAITVALHTLLYLGILLLAGVTIFEAAIARRAVAGSRGVTAVAGVVALASAMLLVPFSALSALLLEPPALLQPDLWMPLVLWPPVAVALAVGAGVAGVLLLRRSGRAGAPGAVGLAVLLSAAPVLTGHSATLEPAVVRVADALHLLAAAVWVGGLVGLIGLLLPRDDDTLPGDPLEAAGILERFSRWALGTVVVLVASGLAISAASVGTPDAILATGWGRILSVKLVLVGVTIGVAALNRYRVLPTIRREPTEATAWAALRRYAAYEAGFLACVVVLTALLTNTDSGLHTGH